MIDARNQDLMMQFMNEATNALNETVKGDNRAFMNGCIYK